MQEPVMGREIEGTHENEGNTLKEIDISQSKSQRSTNQKRPIILNVVNRYISGKLIQDLAKHLPEN